MYKTIASVVSYLWKILFTVQFHVTFWHDVLCFFRLESIFVCNQEAFFDYDQKPIKCEHEKNPQLLLRCFCYSIFRVDQNLSGNDYIKEKRFANLIFEVCTKSQEISEENIVPLFFYLTHFGHLGQKSEKFGVFEDATISF